MNKKDIERMREQMLPKQSVIDDLKAQIALDSQPKIARKNIIPAISSLAAICAALLLIVKFSPNGEVPISHETTPASNESGPSATYEVTVEQTGEETLNASTQVATQASPSTDFSGFEVVTSGEDIIITTTAVTGTTPPTNAETHPIPKWDEMTLTEQFGTFEFNGTTFGAAPKGKIFDSFIEHEIGKSFSEGYDVYDDKIHKLNLTVYSITGYDECHKRRKIRGIVTQLLPIHKPVVFIQDSWRICHYLQLHNNLKINRSTTPITPMR